MDRTLSRDSISTSEAGAGPVMRPTNSSPAPRARACSSVVPKLFSRTQERFSRKWGGIAQVNPIPPRICTASRELASAASPARSFAIRPARPASPTRGLSTTEAAAYVALRASSTRTNMSAMRCFRAWKEPMGTLNCSRCRRVIASHFEGLAGNAEKESCTEGRTEQPKAARRLPSPIGEPSAIRQNRVTGVRGSSGLSTRGSGRSARSCEKAPP